MPNKALRAKVLASLGLRLSAGIISHMGVLVDAEKYNRTVSLFCPTCAHDQFSHEGESSSNQVLTCSRCGLRLTREELIDRNRENIHFNVKDIEKQIVGDLKAKLTKAFRSSKSLRVK